ncbi:MAG TPA: hypothetical protein VNM40_01740 [Candidatus Paceibacterota bacterium]|nr:hypothetical protein [Candidatus Paceibacterota bacterium]
MAWAFGIVAAIVLWLLYNNPHPTYVPCMFSPLCASAAQHDVNYRIKKDYALFDARVATEKERLALENRRLAQSIERENRPTETVKRAETPSAKTEFMPPRKDDWDFGNHEFRLSEDERGAYPHEPQRYQPLRLRERSLRRVYITRPGYPVRGAYGGYYPARVCRHPRC